MMRIITGSARGTHLQTLQGDATRPTSERAKEALFSMLQDKPVGAAVLDLFAGSGQLGLEAASRGARRVVLIDAAREAVQILRQNVTRTHMEGKAEVLSVDAITYLRTARERFDLIFLDPPYALGLIPDCLSLIKERGLLAPHGVVVAESAAPADVFGGREALEKQFDIQKQNRYGAAYITVMQEATT